MVSKERYNETKAKAEQIMKNVEKRAFRNSEIMKGKRACVFYCYDTSLNQYDAIELDEAPPYIVTRRTGEIFYLVGPAMKIENTFIYFVVREFPISINLRLADGVSKMKALVPLGMTAAEIRAKIESIYTQRIYRLKQITQVAAVLIVLLPIISALLAYALTSAYFNPPEVVDQASNSTISLLQIFTGGGFR